MYSVLHHPLVEKDLEELSHAVRVLVFKKIQQLQHSPQLGLPLGHKNNMNLSGLRKVYVDKKRVRIVYEVIEDKLIIKTIAIGKRDDMEVKKQLKKLFDLGDANMDLQSRVITKGSCKNHRTGINPIVFIAQVNQVMKSILGKGYTSHSFRQGLITEMGSRSINTKIISKFIGHSDVKTTMRYINPTDEDLQRAMIR